MIYYTKTGDKGETGFYCGRVRKTDPRIEAIGDVDETNAALGVALAHAEDELVKQELLKAQNLLFTVGAELAGTAAVRIKEEHVAAVEKAIDDFAVHLKPQTSFLLPNGTKAASFLHLARVICRRSERMCLRLHETSNVNTELLVYLNRLSSLLFVLARYANRNVEELAPKY